MSTARALPVVDHVPERPRTRGDCVNGPRPCPWVGCRHHLYLDVGPQGQLYLAFPGEPDLLTATCSLDVADQGEHTNETVAYLTNRSSSRTHFVFERAFAKVKDHPDWKHYR